VANDAASGSSGGYARTNAPLLRPGVERG
jgi:hypothetical protein